MSRLDWLLLKLASRLPKRLRFMVLVDCFAKATTGDYSDTVASELTVFQVQQRLFK